MAAAAAAAPVAAQAGSDDQIRLGLPKGRMQDNVLKLLGDAGVKVSVSDRGYRPTISLPNYSVKMLKPQNILEMLHVGSRDIGFAGGDWVQNLNVDVEELLDTGMDPVRIVAAAPRADIIEDAKRTGKTLVVASEYEALAKQYIEKKGIKAVFVRTFGATESFPPEDADLIVDNTATGSTLVANGLVVLDTVMTSSTRLYCHKGVMLNPQKKKRIEELVLLLRAVLAGREHQMVEFNVSRELFDTLLPQLPCMRAPTVAKLHDEMGFAVKIAVKAKEMPSLLPRLKSWGAEDIVVTNIHQVVP